jgi:translation initiation factor 3 subunit L
VAVKGLRPQFSCPKEPPTSHSSAQIVNLTTTKHQNPSPLPTTPPASRRPSPSSSQSFRLSAIMSLRQGVPQQYQQATRAVPHDESDAEEDALVNDYREQVRYDADGLGDDLDRATSLGTSGPHGDIKLQLQAAAEPLEFAASLETKFASYDNYCSLFHFILNSEGPVDLEIPNPYWAWDVIDEFIYQFNSFCSYRQRVALKGDNEQEIQLLRENPNTWGCYSVLNVLYSLIQRSQISEQLKAMRDGTDQNAVAGEYGSRPLYKMLGYFSIIGLLRVHCLLGDFSLALKTLDDVELNKKAMFARVMAAHFTTYYYVGFSYMMMRRYADAIRMFSHILVYVSRTKNFQKNAQYDSITKKNDQMYALIAICVAFHPTRLDDTIHTALREKYGEQFNRMQRGGPESLPLFEELFRSACPKFISPTPPDFDNPEINIDPVEHHVAIFMDEVKNNMWSPTVKSYLKLYTTMDLKKLAGFLEVEPEKLRNWLLVNKQRSRQTRWSEGGLLEGDVVNSSDLDYALQGVST